jgi:hypothetical protein
LVVLIHYPEAMILSPNQIFSAIKKILTQERILKHYQAQIHLITYGQTQVEKSITKTFPKEVSARDTGIDQGRELFFSLNKTRKIYQFLSYFNFKFQKLSKSWLGVIAGGTGISLLLVFGGVYTLTRPCVIGQCLALSKAQQLAQDPLELFQNSFSNQDILVAQQQLNEAIALLRTIPEWSSYHGEAAELLANYQEYSDSLTEVTTVFEAGEKAYGLAHNHVFPVSKWEEIQQHWQTTVTTLEERSRNSKLSPFFAKKLQEYQLNLAKVNQKLYSEKQANINLEAAQTMLKIAKMKSDSARSFSDWKEVYRSWQNVVDLLKKIAPGTTVYGEAQQLLNVTTHQLINTEKRRRKEEFAVKNYNQAIHQAKLAKNAELIQQWSSAVSSWRTALTHIQQISSTTFQYSQAQPLIPFYTQKLNQAENKLKAAIALQQARGELNEICAEVDKVCNYIINDHFIKVNLTSGYMQQVWQTALQAKAQANFQAQIELLNHISRLEQSLQDVSNKTGRRVEVYNAERVFMVSYEPR